MDRLQSVIPGAPQVAFRERITQPAEVEYTTHKKQSGGSGQFAIVKLHVEPNEPGKGYQFESKIAGGAVPKEYIPGVEKGIRACFPRAWSPASRWSTSRSS